MFVSKKRAELMAQNAALEAENRELRVQLEAMGSASGAVDDSLRREFVNMMSYCGKVQEGAGNAK